jgi:hypothetical protein
MPFPRIRPFISIYRKAHHLRRSDEHQEDEEGEGEHLRRRPSHSTGQIFGGFQRSQSS